MIQFASEFSDGVVSARSSHSPDPRELWNGYFDFALLGASWDVRCMAVTKCDEIRFGSAVVLIPHAMDPSGSVHADRVSQFCRAKCEQVEVVESMPSNLPHTLGLIREKLAAEISRVERTVPARVFIDISTCPRYFSLAILAEALRSGLVAEVSLGYSEGRYPVAAPSYKDLEEISFTDGAFQAVPVPGFFGEFEPSKGRLFLVSVGFDGWKTLNLLIRKEPERVVLLLASPGVLPEYERRTMAANSSLIERFDIRDQEIVRASAGDAVEAWKKLTDTALEKFDDENVYYLCSGNKPHSVALALRAIAMEMPTLLYNCPARHLPVSVEVAGTYWTYSIRPAVGTVLG